MFYGLLIEVGLEGRGPVNQQVGSAGNGLLSIRRSPLCPARNRLPRPFVPKPKRDGHPLTTLHPHSPPHVPIPGGDPVLTVEPGLVAQHQQAPRLQQQAFLPSGRQVPEGRICLDDQLATTNPSVTHASHITALGQSGVSDRSAPGVRQGAVPSRNLGRTLGLNHHEEFWRNYAFPDAFIEHYPDNSFPIAVILWR